MDYFKLSIEGGFSEPLHSSTVQPFLLLLLVMCVSPVEAGMLSQNLGTGKPFFAKMSLRARKSFDEWAQKIPGVHAEAVPEAHRLHYRKVSVANQKSLQLAPIPRQRPRPCRPRRGAQQPRRPHPEWLNG